MTPSGNLMWLREEGLAHTHTAEMVGVGEGRESFSHTTAYHGVLLDPARLMQNFLSRMKRHLSLFQSLFLTVADFRLRGGGEEGLGKGWGDKFGLRKVIVTASSLGKIYGLDSSSGAVLWQRRIPGDVKALHIQRDGLSEGGSAQASLLNHRSSYFILTFSLLTGE